MAAQADSRLTDISRWEKVAANFVLFGFTLSRQHLETALPQTAWRIQGYRNVSIPSRLGGPPKKGPADN